MQIQIDDYSIRRRGEISIQGLVNNKYFEINPRPCDVIEKAMELSIIDNVEDYDDGLHGCELRVGFDMFGTDKISYFNYEQIIEWIGGESQELICLRLVEDWVNKQAENKILQKIL